MIRTLFQILIAAKFVLLLTVTASFCQDTSWSQNVSPLPPPTGHVNDYAGVLSEKTKADLEKTLRDLKQTTNPQVEIAVAIIRTTGDRAIADYALAVYRGWKIGTKEGDNPGALLLVAIDDRKYFTEVGRDLEDELPDGIVGSLQRQYLVPEFKKGNYDKGISDTIAAYIATIRGSGNVAGNTNTATNTTEKESGGGTMFGVVCCLIVIVIIFIIIFSRSGKGPTKRDRDRWGGGGFGSSGGGGAADALPWIIGGILSSGGGSGSSSSSDWGGDSGGWGGFGGGGDSGGGGAGGDW